jgi:3-methyladenine DNA glycosylase AlkD
MGVAEGARKVGQVGKIFDANGSYLRKQMQRLGYGFEEQAEITATVMGNVKRAGQSMNSEQLAKETQKYMENLRLVSALTGEDAKAKAKANQDQNQIAAFQQELALMGPEMAAQIDLAMTGMTEIEKKNFRDRVVFHGAVLNEEGAIYEATNRAAATKGAELYNKFLNHAFDASAVVDANAKYRDQTLQSFKDNQAIFIGGYATNDATLQAVSAAYLEARVRDLKQTKEGVDKVQDDIKNAKIPTNDLTEGMIKASTAAQALSIRLEEKLLPLLSKYADMTGSMLTGLQNLIDMAYGKTKTPGPKVGPGPNDLTGLSDDRRTNSQKAKDDEDVRAGRKKYNSLGFDQPNVDPYEVGNRKGRALGGISTGPVSGYMELLHGTEAVVPLSDGRSIPVSLDSSSITAAVNQQSGILSEILRAMQNSNSLTSQIVQNSY